MSWFVISWLFLKKSVCWLFDTCWVGCVMSWLLAKLKVVVSNCMHYGIYKESLGLYIIWWSYLAAYHPLSHYNFGAIKVDMCDTDAICKFSASFESYPKKRFLRASAMLKHVIDIGWTSVRLSHAGTVSKPLNVLSCFLRRTIAHWF